jgi:hypothetical protein
MNDISNGDLYKTLNFISDNNISGSYWYIDSKTYKRYHRTSFSKNNIVKRGWRESVSKDWIESEVMKEKGYLKIYDSGQRKWILEVYKNC